MQGSRQACFFMFSFMLRFENKKNYVIILGMESLGKYTLRWFINGEITKGYCSSRYSIKEKI